MGELTARKYLVKVCGVTSSEDARLVASAGADALGVVLAQSSRHVEPAAASEIFRAVPEEMVRVLVMRHTSLDEVREVLSHVTPDALQVHGRIPEGLGEELDAHGVGLIQALSANEDTSREPATAYLLDGPQPGSGRSFDWSNVDPRAWPAPVIVAGGLSEHNVARALAESRAWGCDAASATESAPGRKDPHRLANFVAAAREYFESREEQRGPTP